MRRSIIKSVEVTDNPFNSTTEIVAWISRRNQEIQVDVREVPFTGLRGWTFEGGTGNLVHQSGRFFSIVGLHAYVNTGVVTTWSQPVISQPEVGFLGIICKEFDGVMYFLLQAKIEPGNVNCVQLSPTLQATRSNYMQIHGGKRPAYLEFFQNVRREQIVLDQLQSEQGARFLRKRNRNIIIEVRDDIEVGEDFRWLTLGQIKLLMRRDNCVNMDTRTVFSGLSVEAGESDLNGLLDMDDILFRLSDLKSRYELIADRIPLSAVMDWNVTQTEIVRPDRRYFRVIGVDVTIANREVASWCQPLVQPMQEGLCVLFCRRFGGVYHYLLQAKVECGNFDVVELAPTIQCLTGDYRLVPESARPHFVSDFLAGRIAGRVIVDVKQSEEGGRFYHEQNRNVIFELDDCVELPELRNFMWLTMPQVKEFLRFNNYLNIQVRSLISML